MYTLRVFGCLVRFFSVQTLTPALLLGNQEKLFWWQHLDINSDLLFSSVVLSTESIVSFSVRHGLHHLDRLESAGALFNIPQLIRKALPSDLNFQTCFDNSVLFSYLPCLMLIWWFVSRCLKGVSVKPMYFFGSGCCRCPWSLHKRSSWLGIPR